MHISTSIRSQIGDENTDNFISNVPIYEKLAE